MKALTKRVGAFAICIAILFALLAGTGLVFDTRIAIAASDDYSNKYYFEQLSNDAMAQKFYNAFERLLSYGEFKKGTIQFDLIANGVVTAKDAEAFVNGTSDRLVKAYGAGRDAFYMDHPDLFYADVFKTSISAGQKGQEFVAYLDSSRVLNTYVGGWSSQSELQNAIDKYNVAVDTVVNEASKKSSVKAKIEFVNKYIVEHNNYGYGTKVSDDGTRNVDTPNAPFIYTSYGALINNESVCEGYAKSFKAVLDRLDIPCVLVQGYLDVPDKGGYQPHMWNYVQVEGQWYLVDVTNNGDTNNKWLLVGGETVKDKFLEDRVVSTSGYELRYPALKPYDFGIDVDENGMAVIGSYNDTEDSGKELEIVVACGGKSAYELEQEGKYLACRYGVKEENSDNIKWGLWMNCIASNEIGTAFVFNETDTRLIVYPSVEYVQFALLNYAPDESSGATYPSYSPNAGEPYYWLYSEVGLDEENFLIDPSAPYQNNGYGSYIPSPGGTATPSNSSDLPVDRTYDIKIVYSEKLVLADGASIEDIEMDFITTRSNDTVKENASLTDLNWDGDRTITFKFTPSRMYIHNLATYYFTPTNLVGERSRKIPDAVRYSFKGKSVVCSKVFNDGRLYMDVFGAPTLLDNSDLSVTDFKDENDRYYAESQRSQLILVASKPTTEQEAQLNTQLKQDTGIKDDEIVASSTYEIDLQICGVVREVPNGSYMQVAFGFPEGYSPDDAGTTFKIYHYKRDADKNIIGVEEIPVIITEYGLIAKVSSFSPFTIVQLKNTSAAVANSSSVNIYACVNGANGGTITSGGKSGITQVTGNSITYDIKPDNGFTVGAIRLNGKVIDNALVNNGKLEIAKENLKSSNMIEVTFVSEASANAYAQQGIAISYGQLSDLFVPDQSKIARLAVGLVAGIAAAVAIGLAIWRFIVKYKNDKSEAVAVGMLAFKEKEPSEKKPKEKKNRLQYSKSSEPKEKRKKAKEKTEYADTQPISNKKDNEPQKENAKETVVTVVDKVDTVKADKPKGKATAAKADEKAESKQEKKQETKQTKTAPKSSEKAESAKTKSTQKKETVQKKTTPSAKSTAKTGGTKSKNK